MKKVTALNFKLLHQQTDESTFTFKSTAELEPLNEFLGQSRALEAFHFGIHVKSQGYNLYAMGPSGIGKRILVRKVLENQASKRPPPCDWCYIHNFDVPEKPIALRLPPGLGIVLQLDMKLLVEEISTNILVMFESEEYQQGIQTIFENFNSKREIHYNNKKISSSDKIPHLYKERHDQEKKLQLKFATIIIAPLIDKLKIKYSEYPHVIHYLESVQADILLHVADFVKQDESTAVFSISIENPHLVKYQVNLLVNNEGMTGAPIIFEENPSYSNLICRVEHTPQYGALITNFTLIKSGALHKANGGFLIIEIRKIKKEKEAWEGLKRALYSKKIVIEPLEFLTESARPISLDPAPIPLDVKIILLGTRRIFYSLIHKDPDFCELFKVPVDFDEQIPKTQENVNLYARFISTTIWREKLRPFNASAVASIIDYSSRLVEDVEKLTTQTRCIDDIIIEADYYAGLANKDLVDAADVQSAIYAKIHRMDRTKELYYEDIQRNFILIHTQGEIIGQVNCLSVVQVGKFSYGHPTRVTATVRVGKGQIVDIQREVKMAGPIHSKGGLIIANFLAGRYNKGDLFSLSASFAFEQIYGNIEGDSASVAELCALLSVLAEVPIKQSLAVTGSIDQEGNIQSIGGVNEKIEGFFDICKARGLTGEQGVLIPLVNIKNLMLRKDIVEAARLQQFFVYPIETIDEALSILTGKSAGIPAKGKFPIGSLNYKISKRLKNFSRARGKINNHDN